MIDLGKQNLLGVGINAVDYEAALRQILAAAEKREPLGATALAVHGVMTGVLDDEHRHRLNQLDLVVPDGQPVRWGVNWLHGTDLAERVYGPDLMLKVCAEAAERSLRICLFGGTQELLHRLHRNLKARFPALQISAAIPSQFRSLTSSECDHLIREIGDSNSHIVFVGLGCPRQEVWVYEFKHRLNVPILAVGAAFNFHAGMLDQAPSWMQRAGLEWFYRFVKEPRRLWKRYWLLNPYYLWLLTCQKLGWKSFSLADNRKPDKEILYG